MELNEVTENKQETRDDKTQSIGSVSEVPGYDRKQSHLPSFLVSPRQATKDVELKFYLNVVCDFCYPCPCLYHVLMYDTVAK